MKMKKILTSIMLVSLYFLVSNSLCDGGGGGDPGDPNAGLYHTFAELQTELTTLATEHSTIAKVSSIGQSLQGRDIWALKISDNVNTDEGEKPVVLLGAHHAREWISVEVPLMIAQYLLDNYDSNPTVKGYIDNTEIWIKAGFSY